MLVRLSISKSYIRVKKNVKFSIGIPAYKLRFLGQCIESVLNQTITDLELIIVNDASPEDIDGLIATYKDERIRYYKNDVNRGGEHVVDNWNKCLSYSSGEFFVLMGDDDRMAPEYLEEFSRLIPSYPQLDIYHCRSLIIDENSKPVGLTTSCPEFESIYENIWHRMNNYRTHFISDFMFRLEVLKGNGGFYKTELAWAADDISSYIAIGNKGIAHTNKPLLQYRESPISITSSASAELKALAILRTRNWLREFLKRENLASPIDGILKGNIQMELNKFVRRSVVNTLAYNRRTDVSRLMYYYKIWKKRNLYELSYKEIFYAYLLSVKKDMVK